MSIDTVVLDLDGTLVDSVYVHVTCWKSALADVGVDVSSYRIHRAIGMGGDRLVTEVAGPAVEHALGDTVRSLHARHFDERFGLVTALDGASELLENLRGRGLKPVLASSGDAAMTDQLLELIEDSSALLERISGDETEQSKPAPELVEVGAEQRGRRGRPRRRGHGVGRRGGGQGRRPLRRRSCPGGWARRSSGPRARSPSSRRPRDLLENLDRALEAAGHGTGS